MKQERGDLGWYPIHLPITEAWLALMSSSNKIGMTFKFWALSSRLREVDSNHPWQFPSVVVVFVYCQVLNSTFYFSSDWNDGIKYWVLLFLCVIVKVIHILKVLVVVVDVVHVLCVLLRLVLQLLQEGSVVTDQHPPGRPRLTRVDHSHSCVLLLLTACKEWSSSSSSVILKCFTFQGF